MSLWESNPTNESEVGEASGVFAYLLEAADTTVTVADTWYPILGTFSNNPIENFEAATVYTPGIKYTGNITRYFLIAGTLTFTSENNSSTVTVAIKKNNSLLTGSDISVFARYNDQAYVLSGNHVVELAPDDEIQLVVTCDLTDETITFEKFMIYIKPFFE